MISGAGSPAEPPHSPEVRVDPHIFAGGVIGPQPSRGGQIGDDHIEIIASYELVEAMGAHITHRRRQVGRDLALHVDIPLLDVISLGMRFGIRDGELASPQGRRASRLTLLSEEVRICTLWIGSSICIGGRNAHRPGERRSRRVGNRTREEKRRPVLTAKVSRQRQHVKDGEAPANGRLPIAARIPSKTEPRLKIKGGGVREDRGNASATRLSDYDVSRGGSRRPAGG